MKEASSDFQNQLSVSAHTVLEAAPTQLLFLSDFSLFVCGIINSLRREVLGLLACRTRRLTHASYRVYLLG